MNIQHFQAFSNYIPSPPRPPPSPPPHPTSTTISSCAETSPLFMAAFRLHPDQHPRRLANYKHPSPVPRSYHRLPVLHLPNSPPPIHDVHETGVQNSGQLSSFPWLFHPQALTSSRISGLEPSTLALSYLHFHTSISHHLYLRVLFQQWLPHSPLMYSLYCTPSTVLKNQTSKQTTDEKQGKANLQSSRVSWLLYPALFVHSSSI